MKTERRTTTTTTTQDVYVADDGTTFTSYDSCCKYEGKLRADTIINQLSHIPHTDVCLPYIYTDTPDFYKGMWFKAETPADCQKINELICLNVKIGEWFYVEFDEYGDVELCGELKNCIEQITDDLKKFGYNVSILS